MKWPTLAQRREDQAFELGWRLQRGRAPEGTRRAQYRVVCPAQRLTAAMCAARRRCTRRRRLHLRATPHPSSPRGAFATFLTLLRRKLLTARVVVLPQGEHLASGRHHVGSAEAGDACGACHCCPCCHDSMTDALGAQDSFMAMQESSGGRMGFTTKPQ